MTREEWCEKLSAVFENTKYEAIVNPTAGEKSVVIVERGTTRPQYIAIWPLLKKTNLIINKSVFSKVAHLIDDEMESHRYTKKNMYDYRDISDQIIFDICQGLAEDQTVMYLSDLSRKNLFVNYEKLRTLDTSDFRKEISRIVEEHKNDEKFTLADDNEDAVMAAFILLVLQEYPEICTYDEFEKVWLTELTYISVQLKDSYFWTPRTYIVTTFYDEDQEGHVWNEILNLRNKYSNDTLMSYILFENSSLDPKVTMTPSSICKLAIRLLGIEKRDDIKIADVRAGECAFIRESYIVNHNVPYYVYEEDEDLAEETFIKVVAIGPYFNNDIVDTYAETDEKFEAVFCGTYNSSGRYTVKSPENEQYSKGWEYVENIISSLTEDGKGIMLMPGIELSAHKDVDVRTKLLRSGSIEKVIALPEKMYGSTREAFYMLVLSHGNNSVMMIDARDICSVGRVGGRKINTFTEAEIDTIMSLSESDSFKSKRIQIGDIIANNSDLTPEKYVLQGIEEGIELSTCASIIRGMLITGKELDEMISTEETAIKYLTLSNVVDGEITDDLQYIKQISEKQEQFLAHRKDIVISKSGSPFKIAVVEEDNLLISGNFFIIRPNTEKLDPYFLKAFLETEKGNIAIKKVCSSGILPSLSLRAVGKIIIPDAAINTQMKIAEEYRNITEQIAETKRQLQELQQQRKLQFDKFLE